jgi:hypothetical protein
MVGHDDEDDEDNHGDADREDEGEASVFVQISFQTFGTFQPFFSCLQVKKSHKQPQVATSSASFKQAHNY